MVGQFQQFRRDKSIAIAVGDTGADDYQLVGSPVFAVVFALQPAPRRPKKILIAAEEDDELGPLVIIDEIVETLGDQLVIQSFLFSAAVGASPLDAGEPDIQPAVEAVLQPRYFLGECFQITFTELKLDNFRPGKSADHGLDGLRCREADPCFPDFSQSNKQICPIDYYPRFLAFIERQVWPDKSQIPIVGYPAVSPGIAVPTFLQECFYGDLRDLARLANVGEKHPGQMFIQKNRLPFKIAQRPGLVRKEL